MKSAKQEQGQGHRNALMDYEDLKYMNDDVHEVNKGNFHSDTEVQRAGLTKFVIEENLEVQLRFDGLDEAHILLGESGHCEDHWGSGFRRQDNSFELETTLHNIPFSSNGENTYNPSSVLRPINVWSEATSPESVQMLLNSIRQDEINLTTEGNLFGPDIEPRIHILQLDMGFRWGFPSP